MIYSASRRTDLPAFYPDVIVDKVNRSRKLDALTLWTKDVGNLVRHPGLAQVVERVPSMVNYTVTGLAGTRWEPNVRPLSEQLGDVQVLAQRLPHGAVRWRFDPILPTPDVEERFVCVKTALDSALGGVEEVTVSFVDPYPKAVERVRLAGLEWPVVPPAEKRRLVEFMVAAFPPGDGPVVKLCCEPDLLAIPGVGMARCVDGDAFARLYGLPLADLPKDAGQRKSCGCMQSTEIGSYALRCGHRCVYCYANPELPFPP
ncbi:MAG: DUF1848 domain-containing protein [Planctomycetaceae bacterium]|nr:DUF1848 domain-containing protein [Planctomycetaceae bacterium]